MWLPQQPLQLFHRIGYDRCKNTQPPETRCSYFQKWFVNRMACRQSIQAVCTSCPIKVVKREPCHTSLL